MVLHSLDKNKIKREQKAGIFLLKSKKLEKWHSGMNYKRILRFLN